MTEMTATRSAVTRSLVMRVVAFLVLVDLFVAAINLTPLIDRYTIRRILDVNIEGTAVVWLSSALLLFIAVLACVCAAVASQRRDRIGWLVMAALFVLLSLDETASLHELAGEIGSKFIDVSWLPSLYTWVIVVAPFAAIGAIWLLVWLRRTLGPGTVHARLAMAALGLWMLVPVLEALDPSLGGPRLLVVTEESLEAVGQILMLAAISLHLVDRGLTIGVDHS